jgi:hypothetical protein
MLQNNGWAMLLALRDLMREAAHFVSLMDGDPPVFVL